MTAAAVPPHAPDRPPAPGRWARVTAALTNSSLRTILVATFTALVIGTVGTVGMLSYQAGQQAVTTLANQLLAEIGDRIDQRLARNLAGLRNIVDSNAALIRHGRLAATDSAALQQQFAAQLGLFPGVDSIGLVTERRDMLMLVRQAPDALIIRRFDAATLYHLNHYRADLDGQQRELIASRDNYDPHNDPPGKPWYPAVRAAGQGSWRLSVSLAKGQDQPVLVSFYALPFGDAQASVQGVLVAAMTLSGMSEFLQGLKVSAHGQAFLLDREGLLIATSTGETPFDSQARTDHTQNVAVETRRRSALVSMDPLTRETARQLLVAQPSLAQLAAPLSFDFVFQGQRYLAKVAPSSPQSGHPDDWLTVVVAPQRDFTALIAAHLQQPILLAGLGLLTAIFLGLAAAGAISRPLRQLNAATQRLAAGDFGQPLPPAPIRELRELGASFDKMTLRLRDAFGELSDLNQTLRVTQQELALHNQRLEERVAERTAELVAAQERIAQALAQVTASAAALRESEERSLAVLNAMDAIIYLADLETYELLYLNQPAMRIFGAVEGQLCYRALQGLNAPCAFCTNDRLLNADGSPAGVYQWEFQNQLDHRWYDLRDCALRWTDGRLARMEIATDITARKQTEAVLRESEERFRLAFNNANTGMCLVDLEGKLLQVNDKMTSIFGYTRQELEGMTVNDLAYPQDQALSPEFIEHAVQGVGDSATFDKRYRHRQGHLVHGQVASSLVRDAQGQPLYFISQVQDATDRKQLEEKLRISEERHRLLADNASELISIYDVDGRAIYISPSVERLLGYTQEEALQQSLEDRLTPEGAAITRAGLAQTGAAIQAGLPLPTLRGDFEHKRKDGSTLWAEVTTTAMRNKAGDYIGTLAVARDISERKRYERELWQARDAAETANRAKSEFLAHMSHEIRTPLNGVLGLAQVLDREPLTAKQRDVVKLIRSAGESLLAIINDILDLSKIEAGRLRVEPRPFDLETLLDHVNRLMAPAAQAKGLALRVAAPSQPLGVLVGDALRLQQVLINLVGNAVKFTEQGQVALAVECVRRDAATLRLRFEVSDTGIGVAPAALTRLFTPFTQADEGITRRFGGTGLGLSISKRLVLLMGGEIGVTSLVGEGSTFWFELPFTLASADETPPSAAPLGDEAPPPAAPRLTGAHLLVVDDSAMNRELLERALALEGATATLAADGQQAVQILKTRDQDFAAVLMDLRMPVMDGLTATRLIRDELGLTRLPVIALTAGVRPEHQEAAYAAGVTALLPKPLDLEQMATLLLNWVQPRPAASGALCVAVPDQPIAAAAPVPGPDLAAPFPALAGIDRERAATSLNHNRDLFLRLLERFADEHTDTADLTARDLAQGDRESAARRMHNLHGGAGQLGALDLTALAKDLEQVIERGETPAPGQLADLGRQLADLLAASAPWREAAAAVAPAPLMPSTLDLQDLEALREDLRRHNLKARRRFEALRPALAGAVGEARTTLLGRAIRGLRFEEAITLLDEATAHGGRR